MIFHFTNGFILALNSILSSDCEFEVTRNNKLKLHLYELVKTICHLFEEFLVVVRFSIKKLNDRKKKLTKNSLSCFIGENVELQNSSKTKSKPNYLINFLSVDFII